MATLAVTYGTRCWIADLIRAGWTPSVSEHRAVGRYRMRLVDDLEDVVREAVGPPRVGVLLVREPDAVFVPTADEGEARELLEAALEEVDG